MARGLPTTSLTGHPKDQRLDGGLALGALGPEGEEDVFALFDIGQDGKGEAFSRVRRNRIAPLAGARCVAASIPRCVLEAIQVMARDVNLAI